MCNDSDDSPKVSNFYPILLEVHRMEIRYFRTIITVIILVWMVNLLPITIYLKKSHLDMRRSFEERGGFFMMSISGGLKPSAVAGSPSVTKFTHSSCTGISASGIPRAAVRNMLQEIIQYCS